MLYFEMSVATADTCIWSTDRAAAKHKAGNFKLLDSASMQTSFFRNRLRNPLCIVREMSAHGAQVGHQVLLGCHCD